MSPAAAIELLQKAVEAGELPGWALAQVRDGWIGLDSRVAELLPGFDTAPGKAEITVGLVGHRRVGGSGHRRAATVSLSPATRRGGSSG